MCEGVVTAGAESTSGCSRVHRGVCTHAVRRWKPFVTALLLATWNPAAVPYVFALAALADDVHQVTLRVTHGHVDVVLHHHDDVATAGDTVGGGVDHEHGDHVIHGADSQHVRSSRLAAVADAPHAAVPSPSAPANAGGGAAMHAAPGARARPGAAAQRRTVVLRI